MTIELNYDLLKENFVEVEVLKDLNMGDDSLDLLMNQTNGIIPEGFIINEDEEVIIPAGTKAKFCVQPYNCWYDIAIKGAGVEIHYDVALEDDELNEYIKGLNVIGPNTLFDEYAKKLNEA
jgi:hypothetical protein